MYIDLIITVEFIKPKENYVLIGIIEREVLTGWLKVKFFLPLLFEKVPSLLGFPTI